MIAFDNSYVSLPDHFFTRMPATPVAAPAHVAVNADLAGELGIDAGWLRSDAGLAVLAGNAVPEGAAPLAQVYAGHQFGGWSPQLGDGRALLLGEVIDINGLRRDIQLKGSGPTPYSRRGDGRAGLGPVIREYLVSEAMYALGVPTTRALAAVTTGQPVQRERAEPGAVLTRVAASHIRVGTFQYFAAQRDVEALRALTDHAIARHYPDADGALGLLDHVVRAQAQLIAHWMSLGFVHGVMNTDNMTISGETIDYGPCAFLDGYQQNKVFSSIDHGGRYAYNRQPDIALWNLAQLASALLPLIDADQNAAVALAGPVLNGFATHMQAAWLARFRAKLGLTGSENGAGADADADGDEALITELLSLMHADRADFTNIFRGLADGSASDWITNRPAFDTWHAAWRARLRGGDDPALPDRLRAVNPAVIPRNHLVARAIAEAEDGDTAFFHRMLAAVTAPFETPEDQLWTTPPAPGEEVQQTFCGT